MGHGEVSPRVLFAGQASGPLLRLAEPLSFWGGVDPASGRIINTRHPQHGLCIAGTILALPGTLGSSSSSAVMLELISTGHAPAGMILAKVDAILIIGCIVGDALGYQSPPVVELSAELWPSGGEVSIGPAGQLTSKGT